MQPPPAPPPEEKATGGSQPSAFEDLPQPEPLSANVQEEAAPLIPLFGEHLTQCVYSKTWSLRDAALQKLAQDLRSDAHGDRDPGQLLKGYVVVLRRCIPDKNVQVFLAGAGLLQAMVQQIVTRGPLRRPEVQSALDPLMPLLVDRLGDANARVDSHARDALLDFTRCERVGVPFTAQHLLRPPKKKAVAPRVYSSRLNILTGLVYEVGVQPDNREGLPLDPTAQLAMDWYGNASSEVRENAVRLVAACYSHVGLGRIEKYLANLRQTQREIFDAEFEKVSNGQGADLAPPSGRGGAGRTAAFTEEPVAMGSHSGLPSPQVPPPRRGSTGGSPPSARPKVEDSVQRHAAGQPDAYGYYEDEVDETTCQFCGYQDPTFTQEGMDVHYFRECPMLALCEHCQQVIEISSLRAHLCEECESGAPALAAARDLAPGRCPLCGTSVGPGEEEDWREHLLYVGCPRNPRNMYRPQNSRGFR